MVKHGEKSRSGEKQIEVGCGLERSTCSGTFEGSSLAPVLVSLESGLIPQPQSSVTEVVSLNRLPLLPAGCHHQDEVAINKNNVSS